jgi:Rrf2 family protein
MRVVRQPGAGDRPPEREPIPATDRPGRPESGQTGHPADSTAPHIRAPAGHALANEVAMTGHNAGMRLSARADYALRAAIELAASPENHTTAEQLARSQSIPGKFLEAILTQLRRAGLVRSQRGPEGGFWLARPASEISLADIIRAIDGPLVGVRGERPEKVGYLGAAEPLQKVWIALRANERAILEEVTLDHIVSGVLPPRIRRLTGDPEAWLPRTTAS